MNTHSSPQDLLAAYGQTAGLPELKFDHNGCARLLFESSTAIDLEVDEPSNCIQMYSVLGPVPAGNREPLYRNLLEGNLFGTHTGGAALSIDPVQEEILLCGRADLNAMTADLLAESLQAFAGVASLWKQRFSAGDLAANDAGNDTAAGQWQGAFLRG